MGKRNLYMDALSVMSCIAVIFLHCSTVVFANQGNLLWSLSVVAQSIFCFAVPVFFMISGANLLGYRDSYDTATFLKRRIKRIAVPLIGFSALYYLLGSYIPSPFGLGRISPSIGGFVEGVLTNGICDVYWFMYAILGLYLITPLVSLAARDKRLLQYLLVVSFISSSLIPLVNRFAPNHALLNLFSVRYVAGPMFLYLVGYYIHNHMGAPTRRERLAALGAIVASLLVMVIMTWSINVGHTVESGNFAAYDNFYVNIEHPFCILYSCSIFYLFKSYEGSLRGASPKFQGVLMSLSAACLNVYLIHMLVIHTLDAYVPHRVIWDLGIRPLVVIAISFAFSSALRRIGWAMGRVPESRGRGGGRA